jgi:hypothetical protein
VLRRRMSKKVTDKMGLLHKKDDQGDIVGARIPGLGLASYLLQAARMLPR